MGGWGGTDRLEKSPHLTPMATGRKTAERKGEEEESFASSVPEYFGPVSFSLHIYLNSGKGLFQSRRREPVNC